MPAVATSVAYIDGVTGGNVFVMTLDGARKLAAAMMGMEEPEDPNAPELSELELSAVSEAMNQMMASAAIAISSVLGTEVEIGTPGDQDLHRGRRGARGLRRTPRTPCGRRSPVCGEPCRLVQLVPNAFVVRMTRALDELGLRAGAAGRAGRRRAAAGRGAAVAGRPSLAGHPRARVGRARPHPDAVRPGGRHAVRLGGRAQPSCRRAD